MVANARDVHVGILTHADLPYLTTRNLIAVATGDARVPVRALAFWYGTAPGSLAILGGP
jgi:hypothetical protein